MYDINFVSQNFSGKKRRFVTLFNDFVLFFKNLGLWQRFSTIQNSSPISQWDFDKSWNNRFFRDVMR